MTDLPAFFRIFQLECCLNKVVETPNLGISTRNDTGNVIANHRPNVVKQSHGTADHRQLTAVGRVLESEIATAGFASLAMTIDCPGIASSAAYAASSQ
jgi:hypothetical protein